MTEVFRRRSRGKRALVALPAAFVVAAMVGGIGASKKAVAEAQPTQAAKAPASDFKPTLEMPLPPMESPLTFHLSDEASYWYDNGRQDLEGFLHTRSLVAGATPTKVKFEIGEPFTAENHTVSSIVWPTGAKNMPFLQNGAQQGSLEVDLVTPGLYAFQCKVHPYMLGAVVVDDPSTPGADLGKSVRWIDGTDMPTYSDEILKIVRSFFIVTEPANWQVYADHDTTWDPSYPAAPVLTYEADGSPHLIPNLDAFYQEMFQEPITLKAPVKPSVQGLGTFYYDTQWEHSAGKTKPGSITAYDAETWEMTNKWFGPSVNMNGSHNMWSDKDGKFLYQTNWFSNKLTVFDRKTGAVLRNVEVGPSPSHVVTRPGSDNLVIPNNGGNRLVELDAGANKVIKSYLTQKPGEAPAMPHAHWVSFDGKYVVAPLSNESTAGIINMDMNTMMKPESGGFPVATSMSNDGKRSYVANLLDHTVTCLSNEAPACPTPSGGIVPSYQIDLRQNYDKITGKASGPYGLSPIQLPISPDDSYMLVVGTFTANVLVIDMHTNKIVKSLPCGPGCHGINFGFKKGGGYLGLVSIKFANKAIVVDGDPNGDGDASDAVIAGEMLTNAGPTTQMDDTPTSNLGQGGNGVFAYPIPYNGWAQEMPDEWKSKMTCKQLAPLSQAVC